MDCFFTCSAWLALACFCADFFWFDFGDLSPIILIVFCVLTPLRHVGFSEGQVNMLPGAVTVNGRRKIIWRAAA